MVMQVHSETKYLEDFDLEMMQRFAQAFPSQKLHDPKENLITVINFMENIETEKL